MPSTLNSLKSIILALSSFFFPLPKNHPDPSSPTKAHPSKGGEYSIVLRRWGNDRTVVCLLSFLFSLSSFLYKKTSKLFPKQTKNTRVFPSFGGVAFQICRNEGWFISGNDEDEGGCKSDENPTENEKKTAGLWRGNYRKEV